MRVAVDLSFIRPDHTNGGTESCIKNLMKGWINAGVIEQFLFFIHEDVEREYRVIFPECKFITYRCPGTHKLRTTWFQSMVIPHWLIKYQIDILYYPSYTTGYYLSISTPVVVNPHDIQFRFFPEYFSRWKRLYLNMGYKHSLKRADKIFAISDYVKSTLLQFYKKECENKIITVYDPIDFDKSMESIPDDIRLPFILSVSSVQKHKNMITLVKAFDRISDRVPHQLVIVGCKGNGMDSIREYLKSRHLDSRVLFTDYIEDSQLSWLYGHADLYVTTSLYEGFGMTPVEAMGRGIKTICSTATSLPEVTMKAANYYEPAEDDEILAETIETVLKGNGNPAPDPNLFREYYDKTYIAKRMFQIFEDTILMAKEKQKHDMVN